MENPLQKRLLLEQREKRLHEQLAEDTRQLQIARATLKRCEASLEKTLKELHDVRQEYDELTRMIEGLWNGPQPPPRRDANM